jgi:anti-anti-sigma factor
MSALALASVVDKHFSLASSLEGSSLRLRLVGNADMNSLATLQSYVARLHPEARRIKAAEVVLDFHELYFMNSSCLNVLVGWIKKVHELRPADRYKIKFLANSNLPWQRRSLDALRGLALDLISIETTAV